MYCLIFFYCFFWVRLIVFFSLVFLYFVFGGLFVVVEEGLMIKVLKVFFYEFGFGIMLFVKDVDVLFVLGFLVKVMIVVIIFKVLVDNEMMVD